MAGHGKISLYSVKLFSRKIALSLLTNPSPAPSVNKCLLNSMFHLKGRGK
jgi:hypothetical protein